MALTIEQKPLYDVLPSGESILFTVKDLSALSYKKVKYIARVYAAKKTSDLGTASTLDAASLISTTKVNPNSSGVGIFDLSPILDNFVSPDYLGGHVLSDVFSHESQYITVPYDVSPHTIHQIDKYSSNRNTTIFFRVLFNMEWASNATESAVETASYLTSETHLLFNGFLNENDILKEDNGNYGYNLSYHDLIMNDGNAKFLTNAPLKQYLRKNDFHTMAFFTNMGLGATPSDFTVGTGSATQMTVRKLTYTYYYNGASVSTFDININGANGGKFGLVTDSNTKLHYAGVGSGNHDGWTSLPTNWDYYTVVAKDNSGAEISQTYSFYQQTEDCKGYELIRLGWLNQWGAWDYYNFTKKSIRTISKDTVQYQQHKGTWNEPKFIINGYQGGSRTFKSKATEAITVNTDFITEEEGIWLEELFLSNDVFMLNKRTTDYANEGYTRKYIEPVLITSSDHIRKTTANDKLIQYTFELEKSKQRKTHRV